MHPGAVIEHPLQLSASAHANLRENLRKKYEGLGRSHEFMLIDEGMKIEFPEVKLVDAQFLEQMKLSDAQVCGLFRVPQMLIASGDHPTTYASAEQFMDLYRSVGIMPDLARYQKAIRRDLLLPEERKHYRAKFDTEPLFLPDTKSRFDAYQVAINSEFMNPNEVRAKEGWNPYPSGEEYRTRTSTVKQPQAPEPAKSGGPAK